MAIYSPKQSDVWLNATGRWNILSGAARAGKTRIGYDLIPKRIASLPAGNCLLLGKTERTIKRNIIDPMQLRFGRAHVTDISNGECRIFGRRFYAFGANDERSLTKLQGVGAVYAYGDEVTTWPESIFQMLKSRLSEAGATFDGTCNPEGPYHWLKTGLIDREAELDVKHWHFTIDDNPFLDPQFVIELKREYVGVWYQRMILGLWVAAEGAIYSMLDRTLHVTDALPAMKKYWVGVDYGTASVTTCPLLGLGEDDRLYFIDRWRWDVAEKHAQQTDYELAQSLDEWLQGLKIQPESIVVPADAASFFLQLQRLRNEKRRRGEKTHLPVVVGADQSPGSVKDGIREVSSLLAADRLRFSQKLEREGGLKEWEGYVWDSKAVERGEDAPLKQNDHEPDAGRYVIMAVRHIWQRWLGQSREA